MEWVVTHKFGKDNKETKEFWEKIEQGAISRGVLLVYLKDNKTQSVYITEEEWFSLFYKPIKNKGI